MEVVSQFVDFFLHLDKHLGVLIQNYGVWTYAILFLIVFCETGLVVTPILPGDSLLFAAGAFAAVGALDPWLLCGLLTAAAILGDAVNYMIGAKIGPRVFYKENVRFLNKEYLKRTHDFYEKHGGKTIIIARFMPIIRTFAPFVAGVGKMTYARFAMYNITGAILWVLSFVLGGYYFGNIPVVKRNFTLVIFAIILISILPGIIAFVNERRKKLRNQESA